MTCRSNRNNKKQAGKTRAGYRFRMIGAILLFALCVSFFSCGESGNIDVTSSTSSSKAVGKSTAASAQNSGTTSSSPASSGESASSTEYGVQTGDTTQDQTSVTYGTETTSAGNVQTGTTSADTKRSNYSDLPIYSPAVTDTVTFTKDGLKIYNSDFRLSSSLQEEFRSLKNNYPLSFTFTLRDLETEAIVSYNDAEKYRSASSIKGPYGLYAAKVIDTGKVSLNDTVTFTQALYDPDGSGILTPADFGKTYNVKRLEYLMIHYSDNAGYFMLSSVTGGRDGMNAMVRDLGCDDIIVGSPYWGRLTSREMGLVWREIYYYGQSGTAGGTRVYELFRKAKYNDLHSYMGYEVVHKSGWGNKSFNDAGIVYYKDRHFVAVVFVERVDKWDEDSAKGQFKKVCKFLVKVMKEYKAYYDRGFTLPTEKTEVTTAAPVTAAPTQAPTQPVVTDAPTTKATEAPTTKATTAVPTVATTEAPTVKTEAPTTEAAPPPSTSAPAAE